jgi:hypothetical protein
MLRFFIGVGNGDVGGVYGEGAAAAGLCGGESGRRGGGRIMKRLFGSFSAYGAGQLFGVGEWVDAAFADLTLLVIFSGRG